MALITPVSPSIDASTALVASQLSGDLIAGEDLLPCAPCYIKASDGKVYLSNGTAANEAARVHGFTPDRTIKAGQAITLYKPGVRMKYGTGLTPGAPYYVGATAGRLDTAATIGGTVPVAHAVTAKDIIFDRTVLA